jgi:hypothetical protein
MGVSDKYLSSGIKREWYICMYVYIQRSYSPADVTHLQRLGNAKAKIGWLTIIISSSYKSIAHQTLHFGLCTALISKTLALISNCKCICDVLLIVRASKGMLSH